MPKFVVEYNLDYVHTVEVGVEADTPAAACARAQAAFDDGTLWDNTPDLPLLYDDFEEVEGGQPLAFTATPVEQWPAPDGSVLHLTLRAAARQRLTLLQDIEQRCPLDRANLDARPDHDPVAAGLTKALIERIRHFARLTGA